MAIDPLPPSPARTQTQDIYSARWDALLAALPAFITQFNAQSVDVNEASELAVLGGAIAAAAGAFKGRWVDLTGPIAVPASVAHNGKFWALLADLADVTTNEPGVGAGWQVVDITVDIASALEVIAGTAGKLIDSDVLYNANAPVALTDGATITPDFNAGRKFVVTLGGNRTLANPTNQRAGQEGIIIVKQDATGSRLLSYGTAWKFSGGVPTLTIAANAVDVIAYYVEADGTLRCTWSGDFK